MNILLDTNVASEMMRDSPNPLCKAWITACSLDDLYFSTVGEAELRAGEETKPMGKRRNRLSFHIRTWLQAFSNGRILSFDRKAAQEYAYVYAIRKRMGLGLKCIVDMQMSAIARANDMAIATRNVKDFEHVGLEIINPWQAETEIREIPAISYISGLAA